MICQSVSQSVSQSVGQSVSVSQCQSQTRTPHDYDMVGGSDIWNIVQQYYYQSISSLYFLTYPKNDENDDVCLDFFTQHCVLQCFRLEERQRKREKNRNKNKTERLENAPKQEATVSKARYVGTDFSNLKA
jgi:hypothetical protein